MTNQDRPLYERGRGPITSNGPSTRVVLIVDDEPDVLEELSFTLETAGFTVLTANSVASAEAVLGGQDSVLAVLTDIRMPGATGLSLAQRLLASRSDDNALELVLMTGHATVNDAAAAVRAGAFDFLQKPFSVREVVERVTAAVERAVERRSLAAHTEATRHRLLAAEERFEAFRYQDQLTGLPNREGLRNQLDARSASGAEEAALTAIMVIEIQRFGSVNAIVESDGDGAAAVLNAVASRLKAAAIAGAVVARHEGAVFSLAFPTRDASGAVAAADELLQCLSEPLRIGRRDLCLGFSIGVAHRDMIGDGDLLLAAEAASHAAEKRGGSSVAAFDQGSHREIIRRLALEHALPGAAARGELALLYQPIVRVPERTLAGFEALLRWQHPQLGAISPAEFIPIAEETGSIAVIGAWVLQESLQRAAVWRRFLGDCAPRLSLNISPAQFAAGLVVEKIAEELAKNNLPPAAIGIELTESGLVHDGIVCSLSRVRAQGIQVSIDDFGTGYSSLSWLRDLPSDVVKFDRSFVLTMGRSVADEAFFNAIVNLAKLSGRMTLAEGIETEEQFAAMQRCGCQYAQGFLFGKPMCADAADSLVTRAIPEHAALPVSQPEH